MNAPDFTHAVWRKSTWSGDNGGQCVEVAVVGGVVGLRDSKDRDNRPILIFTHDEWQAFIAEAVDGEFVRE